MCRERSRTIFVKVHMATLTFDANRRTHRHLNVDVGLRQTASKSASVADKHLSREIEFNKNVFFFKLIRSNKLVCFVLFSVKKCTFLTNCHVEGKNDKF